MHVMDASTSSKQQLRPLASSHSMPVKRSRKLSRPSTAPAEEERTLLPSHSTGRIEEEEGSHKVYMQTVDEDDDERPLNRPQSSSPALNEGLIRDLSVVVDYDWATFISCYASGQWDPQRTPNPPKPHSASVRTESPSPPPPLSTAPQSQPSSMTIHHPEPIHLNLPPRPRMPLKIPAHRLRNSFSTAPTSSTATLVEQSLPPADNVDLQTSAATMRWAAAHVSFAPLSLPSPEHELTDPMRGVTATIPGSHPPEPSVPTSYDLLTPGGSRRTKLAQFWKGTQDVDDKGNRWNAVDDGPNFVPTSAPVLAHVDGEEDSDYFGDHACESPETSVSSEEAAAILTRSLVPEPTPSSVPALPRRICLTRQTSSPLPSKSPSESVPRLSDTTSSLRTTRSLKEEQMFNDLGFLAPPHPPDELSRRRALYKFNIWNTGSDLNFDRIAHLAKLVFNTKGVHISLLDGGEQFLKSEWGLKEGSTARIHSLCGHTILQRGDEPMVVLDTHLDWRFAKNPHIAGPNIRFYAGAPLRTSDGFNIGSLAVLDDAPRDDFSPRQRHTLKEFAAIVMREMELWKDKIQLRIRDRIQNSMEQFSRECLEIDSKAEESQRVDDLNLGSSMERVYDRAAKLIQRTLDVSGVCVMDVSHCQVLETMNSEGTVSVVMHHGDPGRDMTMRQLSAGEYSGINSLFAKHPDGKIFDGIAPMPFRPFLPTKIQYALTVPIFNVDKRPFALLYAYNDLDHPQRFLEGHELSYMRAIGVIILSAVLKRRMLLADKAKSLFISNISHELRTPLHGILAAAELLGDSPLNHNQISFLETVQACGTSLVETVNHVLDFTKLSGNSRSGGVENVIVPTRVNLMHLIEEAIDGCIIGHRARTVESAIGSVYSPPNDETTSSGPYKRVETVVDIGLRKQGWFVKCEKGGIRRILMNIFSNALKFTQDGYVHVTLRQLPSTPDTAPNEVKIEMSVCDTGKGISQNFLKNQLFHPFSQENPLQTGTGLGLAIVNSIVQSESVRGKLDVWSEEGVGTDIKVIFNATAEEDESAAAEMEPIKIPPELQNRPITVSLVGFDSKHRGMVLLSDTIRNYLSSWWGLQVLPNGERWGQIMILNEDYSLLLAATQRRDTSRPFVVFLESRGDPHALQAASEHDSIGGFCRLIYKPSGPSKLRTVMKLCIHALQIATPSENDDEHSVHYSSEDEPSIGRILRRKSEDHAPVRRRPKMMPRSITASPAYVNWDLIKTDGDGTTPSPISVSPTIPESEAEETISVGNGGTLLKSSMGTVGPSERQCRVLVVEDNSILRNLLVKWLKNKGYDLRDAVDGRDGVNIFQSEGPFDVVLLDLSMPILDGVGATRQIRQVEESLSKSRSNSYSNQNGGRQHTRILALTGMSSLEDKRRAFAAGVDGYLVKPVAFKTLGEMFSKLGLDA